MTTRSVILRLEGLQIVGQLYLPTGKSPYPTVCVCHGIPRGTTTPGDKGYPFLAEKICRQGFAVFIFSFRGTGGSGGNFDILGWARDLQASINYLWALPEVDKLRLSLLGFSGGAAVAIYVASSDSRVSSVITCACPAEFTFFTDVKEPWSIVDHFRTIGTIRDNDFPASVQSWLSGFRMISPIEYIAGVAPRPILLLHGSQDELVDVSHAYRLHAKAGESKQIIVIDGAGHRLRHDEKAMAVVIDWLKTQMS